MINKDTINLILETARIEDVVGDFVTLKRRGVNLLGNCPFHNEKTPSFTVSPVKGIFKCFGCGKAGDSVKFIMEHEHFSYPEALKYLARRYNIEVEETLPSPEQIQSDNEKESLYAANHFALQYFIDQLKNSDEGKTIGLSYFRERGFTVQTIDKFQLGYAPEDRNAFLQKSAEKGYKKEFLLKLGLIKENERGEIYDYFRARVMFPIFNISGRVLGFGGRILKKNEKTAKYLNSPESEIYHKSKTLYGIHLAKKDILAKNNCFLTEGYTDVISLHQAGIENVVASSGTSLTEDQIKLIKRFTPNVTILYDGDFAGIKASFRGIDMFLEQGMNVKVILFPEGEDPDSFARKTPLNELTDFLENKATDFISFKTSVLWKDAENDPIKRSAIIKDTVSSIALIPDIITRNVFIKTCSTLMNIDEQALVTELNRVRREKFKNNLRASGEETEFIPEPKFVLPQTILEERKKEFPEEKELIRYLILYGLNNFAYLVQDEEGKEIAVSERVCDFIIRELESDEFVFENLTYESFFTEFKNLIKSREERIEEINQPEAVLNENEEIASEVEENSETNEEEFKIAEDDDSDIFKDVFNENPLDEFQPINHLEIEKHFKHHLNDEIRNLTIDIMLSNYTLSQNWEDKKSIYTLRESDQMFISVIKTLYTLKLKRVNNIINSKRAQLNGIHEETAVNELLGELMEWEKVKKKLSEAKELGRVVLF